MMAGVYYGAVFGGSTSAILINAPGVASTVATSFDGYPMARKGQAGKALTIAAIASFAGGTIGAILLLIFAPMLASVALLFHSSEYFALMVVGLSAIAAFAGTGQVAKAMIMTVLGLIMATVGEGALFSQPRFTGGLMDLQSGFGFITLAMAMFALPEAIYLVLDPKRSSRGEGDSGKITGLRITRQEAATIAPVIDAVRVPPSADSTSQSTVMVNSPISLMSQTARKERPMSRWISLVRPLTLPRVTSRSVRSLVARGSMAYSAVTQPMPLSRRQRGTPAATDAAQSTLVSPIWISALPSGCRW